MVFLIILTLGACLLSICACSYPTSITRIGAIKRYPNTFFVILIIILFTFFSAIRSNVGDTFFYLHTFDNYNINFMATLLDKNLFDLIFNFGLKLITNESQYLVIITSIIINFSLIWRISRQSENFCMSMILYVFSLVYINSMNGIRQYLTAAILFFAYPWLLRSKRIKIIIFIILCSWFHTSAIILIPIFFFSQTSPWSKKKFLILICIALVFLFFSKLSPALFSILEGTEYSHYETADYTQTSVSILRVFFVSLPVILSFLLRDNLELNSKQNIFITNMSLFNFIFMLFGIYGASYARLCLYFEMYPLLLYPVLIKYGFKKGNSKAYAKVFLYVLYFIFFYYQISVWGGFAINSKFLGLHFG